MKTNRGRHYNIPIFIPHLGCPFQCIFCDQNRIASQSNVPDKTETVKIVDRYLLTIPDDAEVEIAFFGGSFTALPVPLLTEYLQAVNPYLESGRVNSIRISTRPDCIDENILLLLKTWGVKTIELGVQSLSDKVLKASARGYRVEDVFKASHLIKANQFQLGLQLMIGLPGDSPEIARETTTRAILIKPDMVRIYPTLVIAGTALETMLHQGKYVPLTLAEAVKIAKHMFLLFQAHDIEVIRMGLQPSEELRSAGTIVAGPFHPSFGELVEQEVFKEQAQEVITRFVRTHGTNQQINIYVNSRDVSKLAGRHRQNINYLKNNFNLDKINIKIVTSAERDLIGVSSADKNYPEIILHRPEMLLSGGNHQ